MHWQWNVETHDDYELPPEWVNQYEPCELQDATHFQAVAPAGWPYKMPHHYVTAQSYHANTHQLGWVYKPVRLVTTAAATRTARLTTTAMAPLLPRSPPTPDPDVVDALLQLSQRPVVKATPLPKRLVNWRTRAPFQSPKTIIGASHTAPGKPQRRSPLQRAQQAKDVLTSLGERGKKRTMRSTIRKDRMYKALNDENFSRSWF